MKLRPTGHRILIQPDEQPAHATFEGCDGTILLPEHREFVATSGTVIALGPRGSRVRWEARQRAVYDVLRTLDEHRALWNGNVTPLEVTSCILRLIGSPDPEHEIAVGDRVAFDSESGLRLFQDGMEYLILDEDDVVVIVDEGEAVA